MVINIEINALKERNTIMEANHKGTLPKLAGAEKFARKGFFS